MILGDCGEKSGKVGVCSGIKVDGVGDAKTLGKYLDGEHR
jgi:hypothetical protein